MIKKAWLLTSIVIFYYFNYPYFSFQLLTWSKHWWACWGDEAFSAAKLVQNSATPPPEGGTVLCYIIWWYILRLSSPAPVGGVASQYTGPHWVRSTQFMCRLDYIAFRFVHFISIPKNMRRFTKFFAVIWIRNHRIWLIRIQYNKITKLISTYLLEWQGLFSFQICTWTTFN